MRTSSGRLHQNVVLDVLHHFIGHVSVADGGLSVLDVLRHHGQVVAGVLQTVGVSPFPKGGGYSKIVGFVGVKIMPKPVLTIGRICMRSP